MKLIDEILSTLKGWFNVETEAEIHAALSKYPTLESLHTEAKDAAVSAVQEQMDGLQSQLDGLQEQLTDFKDQVESKDLKINELTASLAVLQTNIEAKETELLDAKKLSKTLAGQVAQLTAGQETELDVETETVTGETGSKVQANVIKTPIFDEYLAGKN